MGPVPTYMLPPSWDFRPGEAIAIGNIVASPHKPPKKPSAKPNQITSNDTTTSYQEAYAESVERTNSFDAGIWGVFLEKVTVKIGCSRKHVKVGESTP
ncbi:hypothetical protein CSAL01_12614 [Colletotrichum salicis]|uniref:Uncharacterized protein n=1 Tax=Colletotrichum salicis TaxID=1209931 RepID=A0A135VAG9_9PEZI|nr:hypothetical protein CSAL01_12614 [Colletotrichum salicis]